MNMRWIIVIGGLTIGFWALYVLAYMIDGASFGCAALASAGILAAAAVLAWIVIAVVRWAMRGDR